MFHPIISPTSAFSILLVVRLLSAVYATIPDCDEGSYLSGLGSENVADYFFSLQLLGAGSLPYAWVWSSNMGVFTGIRYP